jgi:hypothetical protein
MSPAASGLPWVCRRAACGVSCTASDTVAAADDARSDTVEAAEDARSETVSVALCRLSRTPLPLAPCPRAQVEPRLPSAPALISACTRAMQGLAVLRQLDTLTPLAARGRTGAIVMLSERASGRPSLFGEERPPEM